jgi:UDP-GlcNAc:undecaprenyl-phosphate GlcNAc-1-phosphate transferase
MLLGFLLAVISVQGVLKTTAAISLVIPLALLAVPILDTSFVVLKRLKHGVSIASPDRWHLHHRLLNIGLSPRRVAATLWAWTAAMSSVALALRFVDYGNSNDWNKQGLVVLAFVVVGAVAVSVVLATRLEIIKSRRVRERNRRLGSSTGETQHPLDPM